MAALFRLESTPELVARYNVAPTQPVGIVRFNADTKQREWALVLWGLVPSWAKDPGVGARMINARAETVAEKPSYRAAFKRRRCLLPANGFFEWQRAGSAKKPFYFTGVDGGLLAFAGLWERWTSPDGSQLDSCTILTTDANELVAPVHDRMPVILSPQDYTEWLGVGQDADARLQTALRHLMRPFPAAKMAAHPVSSYVNSPRNEGPDCIRATA